MKKTFSALVIALFGVSALSKGHNMATKPSILPDCFVGGCSSQLCTDQPGAISTCEWRDEYACFKGATCERQKNGKCGWTKTHELKKCLKNPPVEPGPCYVGGCSGQLCTEDADAMSTCEWREEYMCYGSAVCERQRDGQCGWTETQDLKDCLTNPPLPSDPEPLPPADYCYITGCSGQICSNEPDGMMTTCEWRDEYVCYQSATCERQKDGQCGWTETQEFNDCLTNPPVTAEPEPLPASDACYVHGCSGQICSSEPEGFMTTCEWREDYACYQSATCERQNNGECGWTEAQEFKDCLENTTPAQPEDPVVGIDPIIIEPIEPIIIEPIDACFVAGCSSQLCVDDPNIMSTCEWREEYACYANATCERQKDGQCGWTSTPKLDKCLAKPSSLSKKKVL